MPTSWCDKRIDELKAENARLKDDLTMARADWNNALVDHAQLRKELDRFVDRIDRVRADRDVAMKAAAKAEAENAELRKLVLELADQLETALFTRPIHPPDEPDMSLVNKARKLLGA